MAAPQFLAVAQRPVSLFRDSTFADFTIVCGKEEHKVHRAILACHSEYFKKCFEGRYEESKTRTMKLKGDNEEIVGLMLPYFYSFEYEDQPTAASGFKNAMEVNAMMYALADKYQVADLKTLAAKKFGHATKGILKDPEPDNPIEAIRIAYTGTPQTDRGLRDICIDLWVIASKTLINKFGKEDVQALMLDVGEFASDLAFRTLGLLHDNSTGWSKSCQCCGRGVTLQEFMKHRFREDKDGGIITASFQNRLTIPQFWNSV